MLKKCLNCNMESIEENSKFCPICGFGESILQEDNNKNKCKCGADIIEKQNFCRECGQRLIGKENIVIEKSKSKINIGFWIAFLIITLFLSIIIFGTDTIGGCSFSDKEQIKNYYKSPSTVKIISCGNKNGKIYGEADAQNGFGAIVRSDFECKNEYNFLYCNITSR